jgi:NADH dehydrogenase
MHWGIDGPGGFGPGAAPADDASAAASTAAATPVPRLMAFSLLDTTVHTDLGACQPGLAGDGSDRRMDKRGERPHSRPRKGTLMADDLIVVFGGSGFIGRHVIKALARRCMRVRAPMRRPHLGQDLRVLGDVGQIHLMQANVRYPDSVAAALEGATGVVNLVGVLHESGKQTFKAMHVDAAAAIGDAAKAAGVTRVVQVSSIGADAQSRAAYARSKAEGEAAMRTRVPTTTVLRPSIVFGPEDNFFNRFAEMAKYAPALPLIGGGKTRFQPVHVVDVAEAVYAALTRADASGRTYELGGPRVYTFRELLDFILKTIDRKRFYAPLPFFLAEPLASLLQLTPLGSQLTPDQVRMLKNDNVVTAGKSVGTIADLGVAPLETIETIVPTYLWRFRPYGQFQTRQVA